MATDTAIPPAASRSLRPGDLVAVLAGLAAMALVVSLQARVLVGLAVVAAIFIPLERLAALRPRQRILRRQAWSDVVHFCVNTLLANIGLAIALGVVVGVLHLRPAGRLENAVAAQAAALQVLDAFLLGSIAGYWAHRWSHEVPLLWRFHRVHHSIEEMDWLAAARLHPLDQVFSRVATILPVYLLGFSRVALGGVLVLFTLQAIGIHANVRWNFGGLRHVVATPQFHHWHHSNEPGTINRNYAGEFPLLDRIFGTLHLPADNRFPSRYGLDDRLPERWAQHMVSPFRRAA